MRNTVVPEYTIFNFHLIAQVSNNKAKYRQWPYEQKCILIRACNLVAYPRHQYLHITLQHSTDLQKLRNNNTFVLI